MERGCLEVPLGRHGGTRAAAKAALDPYLPEATGRSVVLNARLQAVTTALYVDELVRQLKLVDVSAIHVVAAGDNFRGLLRVAAVRHGMTNVYPDQVPGLAELLNNPIPLTSAR